MLVVGDGVLALAVAPRCRAGAFSCRSAAAPNAGVAARCSRTSQGWRQSRNAAVLQRPATPQRHSAPQREAFFSRPPFFVHCIASVLRGARMEQALELRALGRFGAIGERRGNVSRHDLATTGRSRRMSCPTAPVRPTAPNAPRPMPQRHVPQRYASQRHRCSRRTLPLMPHVPDAHSLAPPAAALRCHAPYAVLLPPLKK